MARGNEHEGLLRDIIDLINELGPDESHQPSVITDKLVKRGRWNGKQAETPLQTVASYFSGNSEIFIPTGGSEGRASEYFLEESRRRPPRAK
jgi:hypothetical protein